LKLVAGRTFERRGGGRITATGNLAAALSKRVKHSIPKSKLTGWSKDN
jgi:hypothetical protein